jgi:hypothetical protein
MINFDFGTYYSIRNAGAYIWDLIAAGVSVDRIIEEVIRRYEGSPDKIREAVNKFIEELERAYLISPADPDGGVDAKIPDAGSGSGTKKLNFEPPVLRVYTDMQQLLLLDPVDEVDNIGWPDIKPERGNFAQK